MPRNHLSGAVMVPKERTVTTTDLLPSVAPTDDRPNGASQMQSRARALRATARGMDPILAVSYRRRASELELELWIRNLQSGGSPDDSPVAA